MPEPLKNQYGAEIPEKIAVDLAAVFPAFNRRGFLEQHTALTLRRLEVWTADPSPHVRRLVSEGTRPRLPWASRLRAFQSDPSPVLALLERLKDDPELYVRRSVANNLNDIGKDHPALLAETARRWLVNATADRRWLVQHALRSAVKRGEPGALAALGYGARVKVEVDRVAVSPRRVPLGGKVRVSCELTLAGRKAERVMIDLVVHYVKANGEARPKVFKLQSGEIQPGEPLRLEKSLSLADFTTRKHFPGTHHLELLVSGEARPLASFELLRGGRGSKRTRTR